MKGTRSVIIDVVDNWGDSYYTGCRDLNFYKDGELLPITAKDFITYGPNNSMYYVKNLFDTTITSYWDVRSTGEIRIIVVFYTLQEFDTIKVNNSEHSNNRGIKNVKITLSYDIITDTTYDASVPNGIEIFDGTFSFYDSENPLETLSLADWDWVSFLKRKVTAKSVILDMENRDTYKMLFRSVEFFLQDELITVLPADFTAYATTDPSNNVEGVFDTSQSKIGDGTSGSGYYTYQVAGNPQRIICVFDSIVEFDSIVVNNGHSSGGNSAWGVSTTQVYISDEEITDTTYGAAIESSQLLWDGEIISHIASDEIHDIPLEFLTQPTVSTSAVTNISAFSVTFNGYIGSPIGDQSVVYFEWGEDLTYGNTTSTQTLSAEGAFSFDVSGLTVFQIYHYRAVMTDPEGTSTVYGLDVEFFTSGKFVKADEIFFNFIAEGYSLPSTVDFFFGGTISCEIDADIPFFTMMGELGTPQETGDFDLSFPSFSLNLEGGYSGEIAVTFPMLEVDISGSVGSFVYGEFPVPIFYLDGETVSLNPDGDIEASFPGAALVLTGDAELPDAIQSTFPFLQFNLYGNTERPDEIICTLPAIKGSLKSTFFVNSSFYGVLPKISLNGVAVSYQAEGMQFFLPKFQATIQSSWVPPDTLEPLLPSLSLLINGSTDIIGSIGMNFPSFSLRFYPYDITPNIQGVGSFPGLHLSISAGKAISATIPKFLFTGVFSGLNNSNLLCTFPKMRLSADSGGYFVSQFYSFDLVAELITENISALAMMLPPLTIIIEGDRASQGGISISLHNYTLKGEVIPPIIGDLSWDLPILNLTTQTLSGLVGGFAVQLPSIKTNLISSLSGENNLEAAIKNMILKGTIGEISSEVLRYVKERIR